MNAKHALIAVLFLCGFVFSGCGSVAISVIKKPTAGKSDEAFIPERRADIPGNILKKKIQPYTHQAPEGPIIVFEGYSYVYLNKDCGRTDSCILRTLSLREEKYALPPTETDSTFYSTLGTVEWTAADGRKEDFRVVQFVRGRKWDTVERPDGTYARFVYWEEKEFVPMPVGYSFPVQVLPRSEKRDEQGNIIPAHVLILPSGSYIDQKAHYPGYKKGVAHNTAFQLKTCIYKAEYFSKKMTADEVTQLEPIACIEWSSGFVYDFTQQKMRQIGDMNSFLSHQ
ncbi:MAG: hypothetical protein COU47_01895 [Candidatus Niyogibacteria bacterium CG10_big_fil_rev_8_21_14_0_10_46_36]|uniref:Uncharacterized protein n=1 Tax=Candidatus Niyogibacteria bacterium CG10_big_fil_rev_8_21_14_0_10_46_36 TaxID=1974726 RepID=A0A2H0TDK6_9BACT|nr:MAG: hypothetical protein COU47_01895 [Candidatus Niyogibacteria bacterium CG10_big_fil_rev_8_21_14_0_10_46_36]